MKMRESITLVIFTTFLFSTLLQTANATTPKAWNANSVAPVGSNEMQALFGSQVFSAQSELNWSKRIYPTELGKSLPYNYPWIYYAIPACTAQISIGCIEKVEYKKQNEVWERATLSSRELSKRNGEVAPLGRNASGIISNGEINEWPADIENHTPAAGRASYWNFTKSPHGGGTEYLLRVNISGVNSAAPTWSNGKVQRYLEMGIFPVDGLTEYQFPEDIQIRVRLKLGPIAKDLWGWFDGKVINPDVNLDVTSSDGILEIAGSPSRTPMGITGKKALSEISPEVTSIFKCPDGLPQSMCPQKSGLKWFSTDGNSEVSMFSIFEKEFGPVSTIGYKTEWWIKTTRWPDVATVKDCPAEQDGFTGIVTTNATMYGTSAPSWDPSDKTFAFQVASPHYGLNGNLNIGYYSLVLPKSLAECRWGKDISQAKIIVSVISSDGNTNIGVSNYSIKNNILTFNVSGFTFSSPTIKVGLTTQPSAQPSAQQVKKTTITCTKGKLIKKISAAKPKCPSGYKKK